MTGFEKFQEMVKNRILGFMPKEYEGASADVIHANKNNGYVQAGLVIRKPGKEVAATVYLEPYYEKYRGYVSEESVLGAIAGDYLTAESKTSQIEAMAEAAKDYNAVQGNIRIQLINREANQERLQACPNKEVEGTDLAAVFRIMLYFQGEEAASALVTNRLMERWGITPDVLFETALKNSVEQSPARIFSMDFLFQKEEEPIEPDEIFNNEKEMYVLTNLQKSDGAAVLLYPGLLQSLAEAGQGSFYILPSSIHELILLKDDGTIDPGVYQGIVEDINSSIICPKEILSNQVYYYDGMEQKLSIAVAPEEAKEFIGSMQMPAVEKDLDAGADWEELER